MIAEKSLDSRLRVMSDVLASHPAVEAAALYGSAARGDFEDHSDLDVLVFSRRAAKADLYSHLLEVLRDFQSRLSLVIYSEKEMRFMNSAQSLFLLHLSREARILFDKKRFLEELFASFAPKDSYREDLEKSIHLLDPLGVRVLHTPNQRHRLSYVYSLFRVFGVYLLAEKGIYEFSKSKMANQLVMNYPTLEPDVHQLSKLRVLNSNFFTGGAPPACQDILPAVHLENSVAAIGMISGRRLSVRPVSYRQAVEEFSSNLTNVRTLNYGLRMWFLLLVYDGLNLKLAEMGHHELTDLAEVSLCPLVGREYSQNVRRAAEETIEYLRRYPLKYFLDEDSKIGCLRALETLDGLSDKTI